MRGLASTMSKRIDQRRETTDRARHAWAMMNEREKSAVRVGVIPAWAMLEDFGGKSGRFNACWRELTTDEEHRLLAAALLKCGRSEGRL